MAIYTLGVRTSNGTIANANFEARTASTERARIIEMGVFLAAATACTIGLGRPAAIGVTPTSPVTVLPNDPADAAGTVTTALAWGTGPTVPAAYLRRIALPATIGAGVIWTFPNPLIVSISSSIILWNITATPVLDVYIVVDE
jgi:hypothetical protein